MSKADQGRREERRQRAIQRRRHRMKVGAAAALGGAVILGSAGAAASSDKDLRATAGIQLASLTLPIFNETDAAAEQPAEAAPSDSASPSATGDAPAGEAAVPAPEPAESTPDAAAVAAAEAAAAAAEQAAAQLAAEQAAAAAAEEAAAAEAARIAAASVPVDDPAGAKAYAATALGGHGWGASEMACLDTLWTKESEWLTSATNASSGAYGIPQALPGTKLATAGGDWQTNYKTQVNWGLTYIESRYGSPCSALNFHYANNWY
ncbi:hypothetical protein H9638_03605 [Arthrobacter sp. Sa2BUA2]|uniref:Transglycosylase SLT domain-containing protein n=1 Tax=Arthrobacter pullicola TaxID=2762224 RepID=A0ABR8YFZ5_9MICC|nr:hypothetical protein [Arthrobacter pullicola]MBD8042894.1 hypothetical protein [Arthrobacter pullicola]